MVQKKISLSERLQLQKYFNGETTNTDVLNRPHVQRIFKMKLKEMGFDEEQLAKNLIKLTVAKRTHYYQNKGIVVDQRTVKDNPIRLAANALIGKWFGLDIQLIDLKHSGLVGHYNVLETLTDEELDAIIADPSAAAGIEGQSAAGESTSSYN